MIKINFVDFWPGFEKNNLFFSFLKRHFDVVLDENPDFLFYSVYGNRHLEYNDCIKIQYTGENLVPDFNLCDYALGFHYLEFGDRYLRFPLFVYYHWYYESMENSNFNIEIDSNEFQSLANRKFCNFIYSNNVNANPIRDQFFMDLNKYKKVDSGGKHLNNIGGPVQDKMKFISNYKFTIAIENSAVPGYTTEKLLEPLLVRSLPIYYGNPEVLNDFNTDAMVLLKGENDVKRAIEEVIYLDQNDEEYLKRLATDIFNGKQAIKKWELEFIDFMNHIFQNGKLNLRRSKYGFASFYRDELILMNKLRDEVKKRNKKKTRIRSFLKNIKIGGGN